MSGPSLSSPRGGDARCVTCGAALAGRYCAACGQRVRRERLTLGGVARDALGHVLSLDSALLRTLADLVRRPGALVRDVIAGRTVLYTPPVRVFLLLIAAAQLVAFTLGDTSDMADSFIEGYTDGREVPDTNAAGLDAGRVAQNIEQFWVVAFVGLVPFVVGWSRVVLRRSGLTVAEHAVAHLYMLSVVVLSFGVAEALSTWLPGTAGGVAGYVTLALAAGHAVWAAPDIFGRGLLRSCLGMALVLALGFLSYLVAALVVFLVLT